jgi:hypothetical protein
VAQLHTASVRALTRKGYPTKILDGRGIFSHPYADRLASAPTG